MMPSSDLKSLPDRQTAAMTPTPQDIRNEFTSLWEDELIGKEYLLRALSSYVSTDILEQFMDDLANGRV